jgi:protein-S-isoprenylcysteine O-methyltransferase Ste14
MVKMTPEQEAAYALDFRVARSDLPKDAQLAYDRLVEQRARARSSSAISQVSEEDDARPPFIMPRWVAAAGTAFFVPVGPGALDVLLPWLITRWQPGAPYPLAVRVLGVALIAAGGIVIVGTFLRFAIEGIGVPFPAEPSSRQVIAGGPYRYVRNPMYLAFLAAILGQALLLSRPVLLTYAAALLVALVALARLWEEPRLAKRFGAEYKAYREQVPGWWPRLPRRAP